MASISVIREWKNRTGRDVTDVFVGAKNNAHVFFADGSEESWHRDADGSWWKDGAAA